MSADEFENVYHQWYEMREIDYQGSWERMRMLATITIQPHIKNKLTPERLLPLPWEKKRHHNPNVRILTQDERRKRMEELERRLG